MTLRGTFHQGRVVLDDGAVLPEGTRVNVEPAASSKRSSKRRKSRITGKPGAPTDPAFRLHELAIPMGVTDLAAEHDHYLYGTPKRRSKKSSRRVRRRAGRR